MKKWSGGIRLDFFFQKKMYEVIKIFFFLKKSVKIKLFIY